MPDQQIRTRPARLDDADQVWPLAHAFATSFTPEHAAFNTTWPQLVDVPGTLLLVAETPEANIVGYLLASTHLTFLANGRVAWIEELMVDESHRGSGIGRLLMTHAEDWATSEGAAYVSLASRRAGPFYQTLNYEDSAVFFKKNLH
ncbi:GNAT family N-acetyltransferase [Kribbella sp. NPDC051137]|uniref:GNAT family N-acetyltransferase n=1 Tax=Kribbella sp. NPDC051137 TaxID=3155045 RepID=UPI002F6AD31E